MRLDGAHARHQLHLDWLLINLNFHFIAWNGVFASQQSIIFLPVHGCSLTVIKLEFLAVTFWLKLPPTPSLIVKASVMPLQLWKCLRIVALDMEYTMAVQLMARGRRRWSVFLVKLSQFNFPFPGARSNYTGKQICTGVPKRTLWAWN